MQRIRHRLYAPNDHPRTPARVSLSVEPLETREVPSASTSRTDFSNLHVQAEANTTRILVRFRPGHDNPKPSTLPKGITLGSSLRLVPGLREVRLGRGVSVATALASFRRDPRVLLAEPDYRISLRRMPNDPQFKAQWGVHNTGVAGRADADVDLPEAWEATVGGPKTVIAVIDTGIDLRHRDLASNLWRNPGEKPANGRDDDRNGYVDDVYGYDFINQDADPTDDNGHGTHVAGIIGAVGGNGIGVTGVNWRARIMPLKFLDANGDGSVADAIEALNYAVAMGARISNNSWGGAGPSALLREAVQNARDEGHIFVASAGNEATNLDRRPDYPAALDLNNVVSVAATDRSDRLAAFSDHGSETVHLGAPGVQVLSTLPGNAYGTMSGTSMAAPFVTGVLSLVWERNPTWTYQRVIDQVMRTVDPLASLEGKTITGGRVNARSAVLLSPDDRIGARVTDLRPLTDANGRVDRVQLIFSEPIDPASFNLNDVLEFRGPGNANVMQQVVSVTGSGSRYFITFRPLAAGTYRLRVSSAIYDLGLRGNALDQNRDGVSGTPSDDYLRSFAVTAPAGDRVRAGASGTPLKGDDRTPILDNGLPPSGTKS
jgi:serine protease